MSTTKTIQSALISVFSKKSIKLKIFTEIIKYIYKDSDLKDLMSMLVKNDNS